MIGGSDNHSNYGGFPDAKDKCVAVSFQLSGNTHYGWIRVNVNSDVTESTIIGYAYETVADTPIHADDNVLPVELVLFNAQMQNKNIILNWNTATEVDNYGFEVQKLQDEKSEKLQDWKTIGFVEGHGNSNSPKTYAYTDNSISESGKYKYRLKQIDIDGKFEYSQEVEVNFEVPVKFTLNQNYPNPFNPTTAIKFTLPESEMVNLTVYNSIGQEVVILINQQMEVGSYQKEFDAKGLPSGTYVYKITVRDIFSSEKKMLILK